MKTRVQSRHSWPSYLFVLVVFFQQKAQAFSNAALNVGVGNYSQNFLHKVSKSESGQTTWSGESIYPVFVQYDFGLSENWFLAPQLNYTLFPRKSAGDSATVSFTHLIFYFGKNLTHSSTLTWDWYLGPGVLQYKITGAGGTIQMNNGTGTSTFARPGDTVEVRKITTNLGTSLTYSRSRLGLDLVFENFFANRRRSQSFMLSYAYQFGGQ